MRLLLLGLDGLNWPLLEPLLAAGWLPTLAHLRRTGIAAPLTSVLPTLSAAAWASFMTGQDPSTHGVFDFLLRQPNGVYRHAKPAPHTTLWAALNQAGYRVGVINFPVTYPPDPVQPFQISGMLSLDDPPFTHPAALAPEARRLTPLLDVEWQLYAGRPADLLADVIRMTEARIHLVETLATRHQLDVLAVAYISPDRLLHPFWWLLDSTHPAADPALAARLQPHWEAYWRTLDQAVARTLALAGDAAVFILSDHGFQSAIWQFRTDDWLAQHGWHRRHTNRGGLIGFLRRLDAPVFQHWRRRLLKDVSRHAAWLAPGGVTDWKRTVAYSPWNCQQGIRLNLAGREPHGCVPPGPSAERLLHEIEHALRTLRFEGLPVVAGVERRIPALDAPPLLADLLFWLHPPFAANLQTPGLFSRTGWATGDHALTGMLLAHGPHLAPSPPPPSSPPRLIDIAPTALHCLGVPIPAAMQGRALTELCVPFQPPPLAPHHSPAPSGTAEAPILNDDEVAALQARLHGLGYL